MTTAEEVLARISLPTDVVRLCLDGAVVAQIRELERQILDASAVAVSLAERSPASVLAEQIEALREQMRGSEVAFRLRAIPARDWTPLYGASPIRKDGEAEDLWNARWFAWLAEVVSRTLVEPAMTPEQVGQLVDGLPASSWRTLSDAAWGLNTGEVSVPFSAAASALTRTSGETSRRPSGSESPTASGAAPSRPRRPRTSTAKTAG